ncbi:hypothetical protein [Pseudomonas putida]|nr:hypothetical protein [Pseudomonas putida]
MNWTPLDSAQLLLLGMVVISAWCACRAAAISSRRKKENGPCN